MNLYAVQAGGDDKIEKIQTGLQIEIPAGETSGTLTISGIGDSTDEEDKSIILQPSSIESEDGAELSSTNKIEMMIIDNDSPSVVSLRLLK